MTTTTTAPPGTTGAVPPGDRTAARPRLVELAGLVDALVADAERRTEARVAGVARGPRTGLPSIDGILGDCLEPGLHCVTGGPGIGKTGFALQVAGACGAPALYVSAEMKPLELLRRIIARATGTFLGDLKSGILSPLTVRAKALAAIAAVPQLALVDATEAYADPEFLFRAAIGARETAGTAHVLVVIDSAHTWSAAAPDQRGTPEYERLGYALEALRALAGRLHAPILLICERNRMAMREGGLHASAGNRAFEYSCESLLGLDLADPATASGPEEKVITVRVEKNRHGVGHGKAVKLSFNGGLQRFTDLEAGR